MKRMWITVMLCCFILPGLLTAQGVTSAAFNGLVTDNDGNPIVGATITALHVPTGTVYTAVSRMDGLFNIPAVKVGGPYKVTVSMEPFKPQEVTGITLKLGEDRNIKFKMALETIAEQITVIASNPIISEGRTGAAQNVSTSIIENMPSIGRTFDDFARLAPQISSSGSGGFQAVGRSNKYNNIQIDGAVNNDLFGLGSSGTPGLAAPISLDAVQEFQLVIAPYDVRQGGFTGASLNAITRSGTNAFTGSAYFFGRNQNFVGKLDSAKYGTFSDAQYGFRIGGPIIKDKLFFFLNGEMGKRNSPPDFVIDDTGGSNDFGGTNVNVADAARFISILKNTYHYDKTGTFGANRFTRDQDNSKIFFRMDYNISEKHRLTLRHNYVNGLADNPPSAGGSKVFAFEDDFYTLRNKTNSTVAQLNSSFGKNLYNELTLNYTTIRDSRETGSTLFPQVNVQVRNGYRLAAGTEQYSGANGLNQDIIELTDNLTWYKGKHTFTIGTHNEFFNFENLYIGNYYGYWEFNSLDDFEIGKASAYSFAYSNVPGEPKWWARFNVMQLGIYAGDSWAVKPNFNLTLGLRLDMPILPDKPSANPKVEQLYGIKTDQVASGMLLFSPRVGFNWDIFSDKKTQLRGGIGIFSGRTPYVWISNQYSNTGIEITRIGVYSGIPAFVADPLNQPYKGFAASTNEINLIDKNFKYPQVIRGNLAVDHELPMGIIGTAEFVYSKNMNDILYQNINMKPLTTTPSSSLTNDGRPLYTSVSKEFSNVIYLTKTNKGYQYSLSLQLQKNFAGGSWVNASYTYGQSKDVNSGTSSQARSNFRYNPIGGDPNNPPATWSNYDIRHRIGVGFSYVANLLKSAPTSISMFYGGRSGLPYSTTYSGYGNDVNGDNMKDNDLIYVPASIDKVIMVDSNGAPLPDQNSAWAKLDAYISRDPSLNDYRGKIVPRNASRGPWYHSVDARIAQDIPIPGLKDNKLQFTVDVINMLNLLNKDWGVLKFVGNQNDTPLQFKGVDSATGKQKINFSVKTDPFSVNQLASRWQMQLGLRYTF